MKRTFLSALICVVCTWPLPAQDVLKHFTFDVGAGFSFPAGATSDHTKTGFNFVASGGPRFNSRFSIGADFGLHSMNVKNSLQSSVNNVDLSLGAVMHLWSLTANPTYQFIRQEGFSTYVTGGYGLYNRTLELPIPGLIPAVACDAFWNVCITRSMSDVVMTGNLSTHKGGYNVGAGANFGAHTKFFVEARYHHMFTPNSATEIIPLTFGIRW